MDIPIYEVSPLDVKNGNGLFAISIVNNPAIMSNFVALSKVRKEVIKLNSDKSKLVGPVLIPDVLIYREVNGFKFYMKFSKEVIFELMKDFIQNNRIKETNLEHGTTKLAGMFLENWIVDSEEKKNGFDVPLGTWMSVFYPNDPKQLTSDFLENYHGFSVETEIDLQKMNNRTNMSIFNLRKLFGMSVKMKEVTLIDGTTKIEIDETTGAATYPDTGAIVADGEYDLTDGSKIMVVNGIATEVTVEVVDPTMDLKAELEAAKAELEALKAKQNESNVELEALKAGGVEALKEVENLSTQLKEAKLMLSKQAVKTENPAGVKVALSNVETEKDVVVSQYTNINRIINAQKKNR